MPCFGHTFFIMLVMLSCFTILCHASPDKICTKDKFSALQLIPHALGTKREIYYSPVTIHYHYSSVTIHDTVHSEFLPI